MSVVTSTGSGAKSSDLLAQRNARLLLVQCDSKGSSVCLVLTRGHWPGDGSVVAVAPE